MAQPTPEPELDAREPKVAWSAGKRRQLRTWRGISGFGGLALACSFFMPAVPVCSSPFVPAEEAWDALWETPPDWPEVFSLLWIPYLFGLLVFIIAVRGRSIRRRTQRSLGISIAILFAPVAALLAVTVAMELIAGNVPARDIPLAAALLASPVYFLRSVRSGAGGLLCLRWYTALCCVLWFGLVFVNDTPYYGLWLSLAGSLCILFAAHAEAATRACASWPAALWRLLRCRLALYDLDDPRCLGCGYLLVGLRDLRCPECGRVFTAEAGSAST